MINKHNKDIESKGLCPVQQPSSDWERTQVLSRMGVEPKQKLQPVNACQTSKPTRLL